MNSPTTLRACLSLLACAASVVSVTAGDWPQWRGPFLNGASEETRLPKTFSQTENVLWKTALPGPAASTPAVWGGRVFVSSVDTQKQSLLAMAFRISDGSELWRVETAQGTQKDDRSNFASASPVTDGERVVFYYSTGDLAAFDFGGKPLWSRNIQKDYGPFAFLWTFSSSPLLWNGRLHLQVLQRNEPVNGRGRVGGPNDSYLLALDVRTGQEVWKVIRPSDARGESFESYATPMPWVRDGREELLVAGGDCLTGHSFADGKETWRWGTWNPTKITHWRLVASPLGAAGLALVCAPKGSPVFAIKGGQGTLGPDAVAWQSTERDVSCDVPTPLYYRERLYFLNGNRKKLFAVDPKDGRVIWSGDLPAKGVFESSPTAGDGRIFMMDHSGEVFVVGADDTFTILHRAQMGDANEHQARSSLALAQGRIFIRTNQRLYCVGQPPAK